jgi:hypothetical protein
VRGLADSTDLRKGRPQGKQITLNPESADLSSDDTGEHRMVPERLPRMNVGHVQFDDPTGQDRERVADAVAVVCPRTGVDQHGVPTLFISAMDTLTHRRFAVRLKRIDLHTQFLAQRLQPGIDVGERNRSVLRRVALAEHVVIDAMKHQDVLHRDLLCTLNRAKR